MNRRPIRLTAGILAVLLLGGLLALATHHASLVTHQASHQATYYCPMHPRYTSDRPGDCPICNMKLVKRDDSSGAASHVSGPQRAQDICYMHNCPKVHEGHVCPMLVVAKAGEKVTCPICGTHVTEAAAIPQTKTPLYWTDPMLPGYKSDRPGNSPMGMALVPVYAEEEGNALAGSSAPTGYAPILVTPQKQQLIGVKTAPVGRKVLTKTVRTVGTIAHDPELYQAQAEYIQAVHTLAQAQPRAIPDAVEQAKRLVESTRIRLKHLGLSDELIQEIATWKEPEHSLLFSHPGEPVWMYAKVYEYELPLIRVGQQLSTDVPAIPGQTFQGIIRAIDQMVDPMTRTTRIRAQLQDPQGQLRPDLYVNVTIAVDLGEVLAIPQEAVFHTGTREIVFVDNGQGVFEPRDATIGMKADGSYEVKSGVTEGEVVVTSGNFLIDSESRLKAALEGMVPSPALDQPQTGTIQKTGQGNGPVDGGPTTGGEVAGGDHQHGQ